MKISNLEVLWKKAINFNLREKFAGTGAGEWNRGAERLFSECNYGNCCFEMCSHPVELSSLLLMKLLLFHQTGGVSFGIK